MRRASRYGGSDLLVSPVRPAGEKQLRWHQKYQPSVKQRSCRNREREPGCDTLRMLRENVFQLTGRSVLPKAGVFSSSPIGCWDGRSHPQRCWRKVGINRSGQEDASR